MMEKAREPSNIEALLPWYVKGTLSTTEMREVEAYLKANPEAKAMLALIHEEMDETVAANEQLGFPSEATRDRLFALLAEEAKTTEAPSFWQRVITGLTKLMPQGVSPRMALGSAFAAVIIFAQAVALGALLLGRTPDGNGLKLAGGGESKGSVLIVRFTDHADIADIVALLKPVGASIVEGPKPGNTFKVRIGDTPLSKDARDVIMENLRKKHDIVSSVMPGNE